MSESIQALDTSGAKFLTPLIAGSFAGFAVDVSLFPIDTIKTRLQSQHGFYKSGGFKGMYKGLGAVVAGSMPTAALFFISYEVIKDTMEPMVQKQYAPLVHMLAASIGEVMACLIRVPTELAKQRRQALIGLHRSGLQILIDAYKTEGVRRGVYRGFLSTVLRDLPFSFIELPIWEYLKRIVAESNGGQITAFQGAMCGSAAGAIAGAIMTPLDVAKTRIMLAERNSGAHKLNIRPVLASVYREAGLRGLFAGLLPRTAAFTLGGFMYFGAYDYGKLWCNHLFSE